MSTRLKKKTSLLVARDRLEKTIYKAGIKCSETTVRRLLKHSEHVFKGCKTEEDAIERLQLLAKINSVK